MGLPLEEPRKRLAALPRRRDRASRTDRREPGPDAVDSPPLARRQGNPSKALEQAQGVARPQCGPEGRGEASAAARAAPGATPRAGPSRGSRRGRFSAPGGPNRAGRRQQRGRWPPQREEPSGRPRRRTNRRRREGRTPVGPAFRDRGPSTATRSPHAVRRRARVPALDELGARRGEHLDCVGRPCSTSRAPFGVQAAGWRSGPGRLRATGRTRPRVVSDSTWTFSTRSPAVEPMRLALARRLPARFRSRERSQLTGITRVRLGVGGSGRTAARRGRPARFHSAMSSDRDAPLGRSSNGAGRLTIIRTRPPVARVVGSCRDRYV